MWLRYRSRSGIDLSPLVLALALIACIPGAVRSQEALSPSIGPVIDAGERDAYGLFPEIDGFQEARILLSPRGTLSVEITTTEGTGRRTRALPLDLADLEAARLRIRLLERARDSGGQPSEESARILQRLAESSILRGRYDLARALLEELRVSYAATPSAVEAEALLAALPRLEGASGPLLGSRRGMGSSGRTDLLIFSGYYGLWLGIAAPVALDADDVQWFAAGILLTPPAALYLTHRLTRNRPVSEGTATIVTLGGHLGTWQGLGWSAVLDTGDGRKTTGHAALGGLGGLGLASLLASGIEFSEGHAAVTDAGMLWGAWYGLVAVLLADEDRPEDTWLAGMLIGSDAGVLTGGILGRDVRMSETRVRWISLSGVLGGVAGFGLALLFEVDDERTGIGMSALGSTAGLVVGTRLTRGMPPSLGVGRLHTGRDIDGRRLQLPVLSMERSRVSDALEPRIGFRFSF